jgi:hypothetical protein
MEEIISGRELAKRRNISDRPHWLLIIAKRQPFIPYDPITGDFLVPPGRENEFRLMREKETAVGELELKIETVTMEKELALERIREMTLAYLQPDEPIALRAMDAEKKYTAKIEERAERKIRHLENVLSLERERLEIMKGFLGYPYEMWKKYNPSSHEEKSIAILRLLDANYRVILPDESAQAIPSESHDSAVTEPETVIGQQEQGPGKEQVQRLNTASTIFKAYHSSKHLPERLKFEEVYNKVKEEKPAASVAFIIRKAKKEFPKTIGKISESTIRKWIKKT